MPKVSVIIPLYNASPYLAELKQVWEQTLSDFELILVDDCSQDDTWKQLQRFKSDYPERTIILARNERNLGPGGTRNHGLSLSSGQYVIFLDGDDRYEPNMLEQMAAKLDETCADVVCCGLQVHEPDGLKTLLFNPVLCEQLDLYNSKGGGTAVDQLTPFTLKTVFFQPSLFPAPWNKMIRRSFLQEHHIVFPEILVGEDSCWRLQLLLKARHIALVNTVLYHYIIRPNSVSQERSARSLQAFLQQLDFEHRTLKQSALLQRIPNMWLFHYWDTFFSNYNKISAHPELQRQLLTLGCDFCQTHGISYNVKGIPLAGRLGSHKLIPKLAPLLPMRTALKEQYRVARHLRRFNRLLRASD